MAKEPLKEIGVTRPEKFIMRGRSRPPREVPDVVFRRDDTRGYLVYRADLPAVGNGSRSKELVAKQAKDKHQ